MDTEQQQYQDYLNYFKVLQDLKSQNLTIFDINADQQNQLMELATQGTEPVQTYARNVLLAKNLISYQEPIAIIHATDDLAIRLEYLEKLQLRTLWEQKIHLIPGCGHFIIVEKPAELATLLDRFFTVS